MRPVVPACASNVAAPPVISGRWCNTTSASAMASSSSSVARAGRLDMNAPAGAHVTPENVEAYVAELKGRVSSVTVYGSIQKLRRFVQLIAPDRDLGWLIEIERQLYSERRPRPKWDRVVTTDVLVDAGRTLMAEAEITKRPKLTPRQNVPQRPYGRASRLLSDPPEELRGPRNRPQLCQCRWHMVDCTHRGRNQGKEGDERPVPEELTDSIERYLEIYRPILAGGKAETNALWFAINGKPMSYASMGELIAETTRMTIGVAVSPHLFSTAGVTTLATRAGDKPHAGSALLHHGPYGPQENYNRASCITAGKSLAAINQGYRRTPGRT